MSRQTCLPTPGLFITGADTGVGKTYITALLARDLVAAGLRVGVYKPAASGCTRDGDKMVSTDAVAIWEAAGRPGELERVCPQRFLAPLAPHLAAAAEGRRLDLRLVREGVRYWRERSDVVLVEGLGGLLCPLDERTYIADLASDLKYPLLVVVRNALGTINHTLLTLIAAAAHGDGLPVAGVVLNRPTPPDDDPSVATNRAELAARCAPPVLAEVAWGADRFDVDVDWMRLARGE